MLIYPERLAEPDCAGRTPLMRAAQLGIPRLCQALLAAKADVNAQAGASGNGWTALHYAATGRSVETCRTLLDHGARVEALSLDGCTPFYYAYRAGDHIDIMQLLHARGARPDMRAQNAAGTADWGYLRYAESSTGKEFAAECSSNQSLSPLQVKATIPPASGGARCRNLQCCHCCSDLNTGNCRGIVQWTGKHRSKRSGNSLMRGQRQSKCICWTLDANV